MEEIEKIETRFSEESMDKELEVFKVVTEIHLIDSLRHIRGGNNLQLQKWLKGFCPGNLCIQVYESLRKIQNETSLQTIMRGLLPPNSRLYVENHAIEQARGICSGINWV